MYDIIIVGSGIAGLNLARLVDKQHKKICIIEKSSRIGGLIDTKYIKTNDRNPTKVKIEAGGAVVYGYQKNMLSLIKKFNIEMSSLPLDSKKRHHKDFINKQYSLRALSQKYVDKYFKLLKTIFNYMDKKGNAYCRKFTLEQIALEILTFEDIRFIEFCYGYAAEFRVSNSVVGRKNIENEIYNSDKIYFFKKGYKSVINSIYQSFSKNITLKKKCELVSFHENKGVVSVHTTKGVLRCKELVLAIPKQNLITLCNSFTQTELDLLQSVESVSLTRIFTQYDMTKKKNMWMKDINFSTIDNPIRQIIPIQKKKGLFQSSYSDWYFANYWGSLNAKETKKILKNLLSETFPNKKIDDPILYKKYYWKDAIHYWKSNITETTLYKQIQHIRKHIYIIGESYSLNQGWCEGAVQTSISVAKLLNK